MLLALYPEPDDLAPARERLTLFLVQYWGGPTTYSDERGHPRLRMRHAPFAIGPEQRDRWLRHMRAAIDATAADDQEAADALHAYVTMAAEAMQTDEARAAGSRPRSCRLHHAQAKTQRNRVQGRRSAPPASGSTHCGASATRSHPKRSGGRRRRSYGRRLNQSREPAAARATRTRAMPMNQSPTSRWITSPATAERPSCS